MKKTKLTLNKTMIANLDAKQMKDAIGKGSFPPDTIVMTFMCTWEGICSEWICSYRCTLDPNC